MKSPEEPGRDIDKAIEDEDPRVIIKAAPGKSRSDLEKAVEERGGIAGRIHFVGDKIVAIMPNQDAVNDLLSDPSVAGVERDQEWIIKDAAPTRRARETALACFPPGAWCGDGGKMPRQQVPWGMLRIGAPDAWLSATGAGVRVAVIDTGISPHPDLRIAECVNLTREGGPSDCRDRNGHGSHVAGVVAALDNDVFVAGVAPEAELVAVKVLTANGSGWTSDILAGIYWSIGHRVQVINLSLGRHDYSPSLAEAVSDAEAAGIFVAAAAGNSGDGNDATDDVDYPGKYAAALAVAATDTADRPALFSADGPKVELAAPGTNVLSTYNDGTQRVAGGTSMASPHVAGAAALLMSMGADNACARRILTDTSEDLGVPGRDGSYGFGLIDLPSAMEDYQANGCR